MQLNYFYYLLILFTVGANSQQDSTVVFKKRVLETTEVELLGSYYKQEGVHSAVGGGLGTEELTDATSDIVISVPLNDDDVLTFNAGFSAYTSASSGNINPFFTDGTNMNPTGASRRMYSANRDDDDDYEGSEDGSLPYGSPWIQSTGASNKDVLVSGRLGYSHSSDDRNSVYRAHVSASTEYDYGSFGFGVGYTRLFNEKNSELSFDASAYLDKWKPIYPTELHEYATYGSNFLDSGYFNGVTVYDQNGEANRDYFPINFTEFDAKNRNSYSFSIGFSQILTKKIQASVFVDILYQQGLLSTPYHRIYFADRANYYIGKVRYIPVYDSSQNLGVYRLADDVERLPDTRFKLPVGLRMNWYATDFLILRGYYRFYFDDWGILSHTASVELPLRLSQSFTFSPMYRFYTQSKSDYFAAADRHFSFEQYYTSDYDLSSFDSHQLGCGLTYTDIFQKFKIAHLGLKNIDLRYQHYERNDGLSADIMTLALKFIH
ncbi:DUF3570 domain-containing protein [Flavobacterium silvaticum]|uniref:DUF3570 domain-containing protein n=1 Tax=Flavobacterium silvaticum TaxID=1852020 RepID=A0A972FZU7_9FLAO|nr:DUF3570 domain-containing protein [Flavobacterium silvaticum]NMH27816.1 DUF3570 domain-containing protein [Flavobacterium silvaticum]